MTNRAGHPAVTISKEKKLNTPRERESGQALAFAVIAILAMIAMTGLIVDGGNAWAQQRLTQNGTDAAAEAGAVVLVQYLSGSTLPAGTANWDQAVLAKVSEAATANTMTLREAWYTDVNGDLVTSSGAPATEATAADVGSVGAIPTGAQGVRTRGERQFNTYLARVVGQVDLTTRTDATAVAGALRGVCDVSSGCAIVPVTFPVVTATCAGNGFLQPGTAEWPIVAEANMNDSNMAIVPLCRVNGDDYAESPGSVGWLDFGCGGQLEDQIEDPCPVSFDLPTWIHTTPGNPNNVEDAMNTWRDQIILIPLFDGTCQDEPPGTALGDCTSGEGTGNNSWFHIPRFVAFKLDAAFIQGTNHPECNSTPGGPPVGGNGSNGCLKGWFTRYVTAGPVGPVTPGSSDAGVYGTQLVR